MNVIVAEFKRLFKLASEVRETAEGHQGGWFMIVRSPISLTTAKSPRSVLWDDAQREARACRFSWKYSSCIIALMHAFYVNHNKNSSFPSLVIKYVVMRREVSTLIELWRHLMFVSLPATHMFSRRKHDSIIEKKIKYQSFWIYL